MKMISISILSEVIYVQLKPKSWKACVSIFEIINSGAADACYTVKLLSWNCNAIQVSPKMASGNTVGSVTLSQEVSLNSFTKSKQHPTRETAPRVSAVMLHAMQSHREFSWNKFHEKLFHRVTWVLLCISVPATDFRVGFQYSLWIYGNFPLPFQREISLEAGITLDTGRYSVGFYWARRVQVPLVDNVYARYPHLTIHSKTVKNWTNEDGMQENSGQLKRNDIELRENYLRFTVLLKAKTDLKLELWPLL